MKKTAMLLTACLLAASCMTIHAEEPFHRSITVTGTGTVTAKNDMATVNLSVQTMARDAKAAARDNADIMTAVRSAVLELARRRIILKRWGIICIRTTSMMTKAV